MNQESDNTRLRVLHVAPTGATTEFPPPPDSLPGEFVNLDPCSDVYRALARILGGGPDRFAAVIVSLDGVGAKELAFFSILARQRREIKVFVYGRGAIEGKVAQAVERGAAGVLNDDAWRRIIPIRFEPTPIIPTPSEPEAEYENEGSSPAGPTTKDEAEVLAAPARVPWLRYSDGPSRTAPVDRKPPAPVPSPSSPPAPASPRESDYEPLLTEEELEALMSDDVSAIAPQPNPLRRRTEREDGGRP